MEQNIILKTKLQEITNLNIGIKKDQKLTTLKVINFQNKDSFLIFNNSEKYTLLYIFSVNCEPCQVNLPTWVNLTDTLTSKQIYIIGLSKDSMVYLLPM